MKNVELQLGGLEKFCRWESSNSSVKLSPNQNTAPRRCSKKERVESSLYVTLPKNIDWRQPGYYRHRCGFSSSIVRRQEDDNIIFDYYCFLPARTGNKMFYLEQFSRPWFQIDRRCNFKMFRYLMFSGDGLSSVEYVGCHKVQELENRCSLKNEGDSL